MEPQSLPQWPEAIPCTPLPAAPGDHAGEWSAGASGHVSTAGHAAGNREYKPQEQNLGGSGAAVAPFTDAYLVPGFGLGLHLDTESGS